MEIIETISPFSRESEFDYWKSNNCDKCKKYECESRFEEDAKCKLAFHIDLSFGTTTLSKEVAEKIGCKKGSLLRRCKEFESKNERKINNKKISNSKNYVQLKIF